MQHLSDTFPIQNGVKRGDDLLPLLFNLAAEYTHWEGPTYRD